MKLFKFLGIDFAALGFAVFVVFAVFTAGFATGERKESKKWQAAEIVRLQVEQAARMARITENELEREKQEEKTRRIADAYEKEIKKLRTAVEQDRAAVDRAGGLRIPRAICDSATGQTQAASAELSDEATSATVRLSPEIENDLWRLAADADEITEQARACQAWIAEHGFYGEQ